MPIRYDFEVSASGQLSGRGFAERGAEELEATNVTLTWVPHTPAPWKLYAHVAVEALHPRGPVVVQFTVDRGLLTTLRRGDHVHVHVEDRCTGLAIIRERQLIAAAGAALALARCPLGDVTLAFPAPEDVTRPVRWCCAPAPVTPPYPRRPVRITAGDEDISLWIGRPTVGPFDVLITRGHDGEPWVSFERKQLCPETAAHTTAELLDRGDHHRPPQTVS